MPGTDTTHLADGLRDAIRSSDVVLSKYNALPRLLSVDNFNNGLHGWVELGGNYNGRGDLESMDRHFRDFRPPQLSNASFFDVGTHGGMSGTYSMKLATRAHRGHTATAIRRLTMSGRGLLQIEAHLAWKTEANLSGTEEEANTYGDITWDANSHPSEAQFGAFTVATDLCTDGVRYHNVMRFVNTDWDGHLVQRWAYPVVPEPTPHERHVGRHDYEYAADFTAPNPDDWRFVDTERVETCYNEVPTKINWHYLRFLIDTETRTNVELQFNNQTIDLRDVPVPPYAEKYESLENLLNFYFSVRTLSGVRNFLFLDSVVISADW
ncbi:DUF6772 family protein [Tessaracoccus oleiagri]|uniref:GH16 domain-containing protein n=1 Tax=Tessaracoccus oleiagri TaxID=686624 RepID=A0A1G9LUH0_9ACTN|nr:DUF6772 family protein [Tessaracoccus oleiagri]SDL65596.1 hypothetical protein SAMN04488242_2337 [Tessaracoccus oleiagri]